MARHHMRLHPRPFGEMAMGRKAYEFRLHDEKRRSIHVGDVIEFENRENPNERIVMTVSTLHAFASFDNMYDSLPMEARGDGDKKAWLDSMRQHYSVEQERQYGALAIQLQPK